MSSRRKFERKLGEKRYRRLFVIATEGTKTEPEYFSMFNNDNLIVKVQCLKGDGKSDPLHVLKRMKLYLKSSGLKISDEAWLVVDKDQWTDEQLKTLHHWSQEKENHGMALSNPLFEYWLLLHFEKGGGIASARTCIERLRQHLPDYDKGINRGKIKKEMIVEAVARAKEKDSPSCPDWPRDPGTTVYRLVEKILNT